MILGSMGKDMGKGNREEKEATAGCVKKEVAAVGNEGSNSTLDLSAAVRNISLRRPPTTCKLHWVFIHQHPWVIGRALFPGEHLP